MTAAEIRRSFLQFFADRGHTLVASSPLVPANDPTLLLTNAGMIQFKDVFLGKEQRPYQRAASAQKCMRVSGKHNDLDNVGPSLRHHTFFEMLGNFSFGDYFKADAIPFAWTLLTDGWNLPAERLFPTVFGGGEAVPRDDEARSVWAELVPADRIVELGLADNFWAMGDTGPCGRCSEIHYHRGDHHPCPEPVCRGVACSCDRFVEIWNNVFMEFERREDGSLVALPAPSIDTGMGLERIVAVLQDTLSNYDTDLFTPLLAEIGALTGTTYQAQNAEDAGAGTAVSMRVVADHVRAMTFLIADGVRPSNEWRGYVLRKIMRRAMRHGKKLGLTEPFLGRVVDVVVRTMGSTYPELDTHRNAIVAVVQREEEQFDKVLGEGLPRLESVLAQAREAGGAVPGAEAFRLHDTYGLPLDFVEDLAGERGLRLDRAGFDRAMAQQRAHSRQNTGGLGQTRDGDGSWVYRSRNDQQTLQRAGDRFEGYKSVSIDGIPILALFDEGRCQVAELAEGARGYAVLERTPFYVEAGGQVSDTGQLVGASGRARVEAMERLDGSGSRAHAIHMEAGSLSEGKPVRAEVDRAARAATRRNHTATHLLHAALRALLGTHVAQAGSLVAPDRLRFDFSHFDPLTTDQRTDIERWVTRAGGMPITPCRPRFGRPRTRWPTAPWRFSARSMASVCGLSRSRTSRWNCAAARTAGQPARSAPS